MKDVLWFSLAEELQDCHPERGDDRGSGEEPQLRQPGASDALRECHLQGNVLGAAERRDRWAFSAAKVLPQLHEASSSRLRSGKGLK